MLLKLQIKVRRSSAMLKFERDTAFLKQFHLLCASSWSANPLACNTPNAYSKALFCTVSPSVTCAETNGWWQAAKYFWTFRILVWLATTSWCNSKVGLPNSNKCFAIFCKYASRPLASGLASLQRVEALLSPSRRQISAGPLPLEWRTANWCHQKNWRGGSETSGQRSKLCTQSSESMAWSW